MHQPSVFSITDMQMLRKEKNMESIKCCATCKYLVSHPKGNRYGDMEHFCLKTSYMVGQIHKNRDMVKSYTPGGKELNCTYERNQ